MFCHFIIAEWILPSSNFQCYFSFHQLHIFFSKTKLFFIHLQRFFSTLTFQFESGLYFQSSSPRCHYLLCFGLFTKQSQKVHKLDIFFSDDIKLEDTFQKHMLQLLIHFQSMNQTKFKLKYILLKYVYCGHQDFSTSLLPRSTVTGPYQLLLKAQPGVFVLRNGSFSEVRVSGVLRN